MNAGLRLLAVVTASALAVDVAAAQAPSPAGEVADRAIQRAQVQVPQVQGPQVQSGPVQSAPAQSSSGEGAPAVRSGTEAYALHAQSTVVAQATAAFRSPYRGPNSLDPAARGRETADVTLYAGARLWAGAELWIDLEVDQGFGLDNTLGVAGFPSGEAYKVGKQAPYFRVQRIFLRQTIALPGDRESVDADLNQLSGSRSSNRLVFTGGKISVADMFDTNRYANSPRTDFLNWSVINTGTFDYAADSWGYSAGAALEWYQGRWTARGGAFLLSNVPNSETIDTRFSQFQLDGELEARHTLFGQPGKLKLTAFVNRARMGRLEDAVRLAQASGQPLDIVAVRRYRSRPGVSLNLEQQLTGDIGLFARAGWVDGAYEAYEFTDIDRTVSGGLSVVGRPWGRQDDTLGLAGAINQASRDRLAFLAAGGLGILIGDGRLPDPGTERLVETYYDLTAVKNAHVAFDYQWVVNPGYNRDRGPASIFAVRLHTQF